MGMRLALLLLLLSGAPQSAPTFTEVDVGLSGVQGFEVNWGDYDNDGDLDLAIEGMDTLGARFTRLYRNDAGTYVHDTNAAMLGFTEGPFIFGDYDNDGDLDIAFGGWSGGGTGSRIHRNDGPGGFVFLNNGLRGMKGADGAWFDYDNDGDLDLLLAGESYDPPQGDYAQIYRNDKNGAFPLAVGLPGLYVGEVSVGDYDRDGDLDIVLTGRTVGTKIFRNDGNGVFTDIGAGLPPLLNSSAAWGDYDSDGDLDLVISGDGPGGPMADVYRNDAGVFTPLNVGLPPMRLGNIDWGDADNDGDLDLLLVGGDAVLAPQAFLYLNQGGGVFVDAAAGLEAVWNQSTAAWGDYDNDGDLDIVLAGVNAVGAYVVKVYRNDSATANTAPSVPAGLTSSWIGHDLTLQWNASADAQTPAAGLSYNLRVGTTPGGQEIMAAMADPASGLRRIPARGNAQGNLSWTLKGLTAGTYYWSVQAVDGAFLASGWASEKTVASPAPGPRVMSVTPTGTLTAGLFPMVVDFDVALDPATVNTTSFVFTQAGPDDVHGTPDDVVVHPRSLSIAGTQVTLDFSGLQLPDGKYQIRVRGNEPAIPGELHRWKLDEGSGIAALDASGNLDGTLDGAALPTWTAAGRLGGALDFTGSDGRVLLGAGDLAPPWTASMWVRRIDSAAEDARLMDSPTASFRLEQFNHTNRVGLTWPGTDFAYDYSAPPGVWTHLAFAADGTVTTLYVNGTFSQNVGIAMGCPRTVLGSVGFNSLQGRLDEVRLFGRRLSETEIRTLGGLGGVVRGLTGNPLDGEPVTGSPSGDGVGGGDFTAELVMQSLPLTVVFMYPASGEVVAAPPATISIVLSSIIDPSTLARPAVRVVRAGADTLLGTGDDVEIIPTSLSGGAFNGQILIDLPAGLPPDQYRVILSGSVAEPASPLNRWRFDEGLGVLAADSAGAANGTLGGGGGGRPLWSVGRLGYGLQFYGQSDRVLTGAGDLAPPWTTALWVRRQEGIAEDSRLLDSATSSLRLEQYNYSNQVGVTAGGVADALFGYTAPIGPWVHLAFVGEVDGTSLYVDGVFSEKIALAIGGPRNSLGSASYNSMNGSLDEVRVYGRKLSDGEIRQLASLGGGLRSVGGRLIDGEGGGTLPSGNGVTGGDFVSDFTVFGTTPPGPFTLLTPGDAEPGVSTTPTFTWSSSAGATSYRIRVSSDGTHSSFIINQSGILGTSFTPSSPLAASTTHLWDVYAFNPAGVATGIRSIASFTTTTGPAPGAFNLTSPSPVATGVPLTPTFQWSTASGAASYRLQVSDNAAFSTLAVDQAGIVGTSATPAVTLAGLTSYWWRVTAVNGAGSTLATGAPASFSTQVEPPGAFSLATPADAATGVSVVPGFTWTASSGAATYTLEIAGDAGFAASVVMLSGLTATSSAPAVLLDDGALYYWRVTAVNPGGTQTTAARAFSTSPGLKVGGGCGLTGWEVVALVALLRSARGRRGRARR